MLRGRDRDSRAVRSLLMDSGAVALVGAPGVGKTSLLRTVAADSEGCVFASAYATLQWQPLFPLTAVLGGRPRAEDPAAVATWIRDQVGSRLLLLDDAQWADAETLRVLPLLLGEVSLLLAVRSGDRQSDQLIQTLGAAGARVHVLEPLSAMDSAALVREVRPGAGPRAVAEIVRRAAGNPLLLTELAHSQAAPTLQRRVAAGVRDLTPQALSELEGLAVVGHPLPVTVLSGTLTELTSAGLVSVLDDSVGISHPLLREVLLQQTPASRRAKAHARAAALPVSQGERAFHLADAGEHTRAYLLATAAAAHETSPGRRAPYLALAARCAPDAQVVGLRMAAAEAYFSGGFEELADVLLVNTNITTPAQGVRLSLLESQTAWAVGDDARSLAAAERASRYIGTNDAPGLDLVEARLSVKLALTRHTLLAAGDLPGAIRMSESAVATAMANGSAQLGRAHYLLGTALSLSGRPGYREHLEAAIKLAGSTGDHDLELRAGNNLVASHELAGDHAAGRRLARVLARRADDLDLGTQVAQFRAAVANLDVLDGWLQRSLSACDDVLGGVVEPRTRDQLEVTRSLALLDLSRFEEARAQIKTSLETAADDALGRAQFAYLNAEAALMLGRPHKCLTQLDDLVHTLPPGGELSAFVRVTRGRALAAVGQPPPVREGEWPAIPFFRAAPIETDALSLVQTGQHRLASRQFAAAATLWRPHYLRSYLHCIRQAALQQLKDGDTSGAATRLESAERLASRRGMTWELAQIRRALRSAGRRRSAPVVATPTGLTARETEVLALVAAGVTNHEIAARLGISRRTVETQLASATGKLGTRTRATAAARMAAP